MSVFGGGVVMGGHRRIERMRPITKRIYSTAFPLTEDPISEGGNWLNGATDGRDWGDFHTSGGKALGKLATTFSDNTALIKGTWAADQYVETVVFKGTPDNAFFPEVEHRLRSAISTGVNSGYEVSYGLRGGASSYLIIVRWNGPVTSFDYILNDTNATYNVVNGDTIRSEIQGNTIRAYINGVLKATVDITSIGGTVFSSGNPGIGTNADTGGGANLDQEGFSSLTAGDL